MNVASLIKGVQILAPHYTNPESAYIDFEYEFMCLPITDTPLSAEEWAQLDELGWCQEIDKGAAFPEVLAEYDPNVAWSAH